MKIYKSIIFLLIFYIQLFTIECKKGAGTYRYVNKNTGRTHYVGATNNFRRRHSEHKKKNKYYTKFNYVMIKNHMPKSSSEEIYSEEVNQIKKYNPVLNKHRGGNGPRWT